MIFLPGYQLPNTRRKLSDTLQLLITQGPDSSHNKMTSRPKLLFILTSHNTLPARNNMKTGWYLPDFVHPHNALSSHVDISIVPPKGGEAPVDPYSVQEAKADMIHYVKSF
jgi:hypothetical protein